MTLQDGLPDNLDRTLGKRRRASDHRYNCFGRAIVGGLGWVGGGVNPDPVKARQILTLDDRITRDRVEKEEDIQEILRANDFRFVRAFDQYPTSGLGGIVQPCDIALYIDANGKPQHAAQVLDVTDDRVSLVSKFGRGPEHFHGLWDLLRTPWLFSSVEIWSDRHD